LTPFWEGSVADPTPDPRALIEEAIKAIRKCVEADYVTKAEREILARAAEALLKDHKLAGGYCGRCAAEEECVLASVVSGTR
jgi:hypothetical protein